MEGMVLTDENCRNIARQRFFPFVARHDGDCRLAEYCIEQIILERLQ